MKPAYAEAATKASKDNMLGKFAAVDCTAEKSLAGRFDVKGFPTRELSTQSIFLL